LKTLCLARYSGSKSDLFEYHNRSIISIDKEETSRRYLQWCNAPKKELKSTILQLGGNAFAASRDPSCHLSYCQ
jgi:hypothetical protein